MIVNPHSYSFIPMSPFLRGGRVDDTGDELEVDIQHKTLSFSKKLIWEQGTKFSNLKQPGKGGHSTNYIIRSK